MTVFKHYIISTFIVMFFITPTLVLSNEHDSMLNNHGNSGSLFISNTESTSNEQAVLKQRINLLLQIIELLQQQIKSLGSNNNQIKPSSIVMIEGVDFPKLNTVDSKWEHCSDLYFGGCAFEGQREVRYGNENRWIVKEYFDGFPGWHCHPSTFGTTKQEGDRCEVTTESKLGTLNAPTHTMSMSMPKIDLTKIPFGSAGKSNLEIIPVNDTGVANDIGAFRVPCRFSHMSFNDPIVHPGQPGRAHLHAFFGNTNVNAYSTASSLFSNGNSTCPGGIANRSAYWIPALIDTTTNTPLVPTESIWYYKTGYRGVKPNEVKIIPDGLKIVTGDATGDATGEYFWQCTNGAQYSKRGKYIPDCKSGETLQVSVFFPQCWDGVNLDSADHQSHMAYANNGCPNSHPVALPELSLNIGFTVNSGDDTTKWRLSSDMNNMKAGHSTHADFFEAWNKDVKEKFTKNCLNQSKDCHAYLLGDGTRLGDE